MGEVAQNFIERFHNLDGETIKEKHKEHFQLLHEHLYLRETPKALEFITTNLKATNHLERIFRIDFLIYFRQFNELYENFIEGDEITVHKLSRQDWFFEKAFKEVNCEIFVNSFIPTISYSLRVKVFKKLPLDEEQADQFFDAVCKRYGIFLATILLPKCTSRKIREILTTNSIKLTMAQLKAVFNKDPDLIEVYLDERVIHAGTSNFISRNRIFIYIAQKNPAVFSKLFNKYSFATGLGRRTSKRLIRSQKKDVLNNFENYIIILNRGVIVRKLGIELKDVIFKNYVLKYFSYLKDILRHYPKRQQFNLYKSAYESLFLKKFGENVDDVSKDILKIIPDPEEREMLAKRKIESGRDEYLEYVRPDYCLQIVMENIDHLAYSQRCRYVELATKCCIFNKDVSSLLRICELICVRFKNDTDRIRPSFLNILGGHENILDSFGKQHWHYVIQLIATAKAKKEWISYEHIMMVKYMIFSIYKNNISIKDIVQRPYNWHNILNYSGLKKNAELFKLTLNELIEVGLAKPDPDDETKEISFYCLLAHFCKIYNEGNPNDAIDIFTKPKIIASVKQALQRQVRTESDCLSGVSYVVCQKSQSEELQELKKLYFTYFKNFGTLSGLLWFMKHDPKTLQNNFSDFLVNFPQGSKMEKKIWRFIKKFDYMNLRQEAIEFCKEKLNEEAYDFKSQLIEPLTMLSSPTAHLEFMKLYTPTSEKVDLTDRNAKELYYIQGKLVRFLHILNAPAEVLPAALSFCRGDYLKFAVSPLYSCMYTLSENATKPFIKTLQETPALSVRKHAFNLCCVIYDTETIHSCLKNATVPSLIAAIKYFAKNPSNDLWYLIDGKISTMEQKELPLLEEALRINMPYTYKSKYLQIIWKIVDKYDNQDWKKSLLSKFDKDIVQCLDSEFAFRLIQNVIFKLEVAYKPVAIILFYLKSDEKFIFLSNILSTFKQNCWTHLEEKSKARRQLNRLIFNLFEVYMTAEESDVSFVSELTTLFNSIFPSLSEVFQEVILIRCMALKTETTENSAKLLTELNKTFIEKFGIVSTTAFANTLKSYVFNRVLFGDEKLKVCHSLLKSNPSVGDCLLAIKLLPNVDSQFKNLHVLHKDILSQLSELSDESVQLEFNLYLK